MDTTTMVPRMIQKSPVCPTIGVAIVFMPNSEVNKVSGKVIKAKMVKIFMVSFCLVVRRELLVSRRSSVVTVREATRRLRCTY